MKKYLLFLLLFLSNFLFSQTEKANYWVEFTDKKDSPFSVFRPYEFLSSRALERRDRFGIPVLPEDLPVNPQYIRKLKDAGARLQHSSRWFNAATIVADSQIISKVQKFPFVRSTEKVGTYHPPKIRVPNKRTTTRPDYEKTESYYGYGTLQIAMVNGYALHRMGYSGEGMLVAVNDGGFSNVDVMPFFDSLRTRNKLLPGRDFVDQDDFVYESSGHGSAVLSMMAANLPGLLVGTAPDATYICLKTEEVRSESWMEECNWIAATEFADSIGADIINTSLGYTRFTDHSQNYSYKDLNGQIGKASRAADIAFSKGMFLVNSAGNSGNNDWKYIGVPADSREMFSIGAVTAYQSKAGFSSFGPTADGRIKPNVAAMGQGVAVAGLSGYTVSGSNGTSLSAPLISGMIASFWQAFPNKTNQEIRNIIEDSADQADNPDNELGYGIPDFYKAYQLLKGIPAGQPNALVDAYPSDQGAFLVFKTSINEPFQIEIKDWAGKEIASLRVPAIRKFEQLDLEYILRKGVYEVKVLINGRTYYSYFIK